MRVCCEKAMATNNEDPFSRIHKLLRQGKLAIALNSLRDAYTGQIKDAFRFDRNHAWYCVGDVLYRQKKFDESRDAFKRSLRTRPDDVQALMAIGNCYDALRKPKFAGRYFARALNAFDQDKERAKPKREAIILNLANALFDQGYLTEAIKLYKKLDKAPLEIRTKAKKNLALAENHIKK
jgi:tetratricopeptide (TPR) repeat protein